MVRLVSSAKENHQIVEQGGEGGEGGDEVGAGGPLEGVLGHGGLLSGGDAGLVEPCHGAFGGVVLHRQGDEGENGGEGKEDDADEEHPASDEVGEAEEENAGKEDPLCPLGTELHHRHHAGAHRQPFVGGGVLHSVAALVRSDSRRRNAVLAIDPLTEVDGLGLRVVMVGESAGHTGDLNIVDAVVAQHLLGYFLASEAAAETDLAVFLDTRVECLADNEAQDHKYNEDNQIHSRGFSFGIDFFRSGKDTKNVRCLRFFLYLCALFHNSR